MKAASLFFCLYYFGRLWQIAAKSLETANEQEIDDVGFFLLDQEIGHIHIDSSVHVSMPTQVSKALDHAGLVRDSRWAHG